MASKITKPDAALLSQSLDEAATLIGQYLAKNFNDLSTAQRKKVRDLRWTLFDLAEEAEQRAIGTKLDEIDEGMDAITASINKAKKTLKVIQNVGNTVALISSLIDLALAINSASPSSIVKGIQGIAEAIEAFEEDDQ
jgi:hypothetical protein